MAEASKTLQPGFNHADYNFIGGTEGNDDFTGQTTVGPDVICGFGEDDVSAHNINDIFLGGAGYDFALFNWGTFNGGDGTDQVSNLNERSATFNGGEGDDFVQDNDGTVNGGAGNDVVSHNSGTFDGGDGNDTVSFNFGGILISVEQGDV